VTMVALAKVEDEAAGLASGLLSSSAQLGGAVGVAVPAAIAANRGTDCRRRARAGNPLWSIATLATANPRRRARRKNRGTP
jgi:hypothetical protein